MKFFTNMKVGSARCADRTAQRAVPTILLLVLLALSSFADSLIPDATVPLLTPRQQTVADASVIVPHHPPPTPPVPPPPMAFWMILPDDSGLLLAWKIETSTNLPGAWSYRLTVTPTNRATYLFTTDVVSAKQLYVRAGYTPPN